ncbi:MAG: delta-1-pyrroline-5-carboxylate dehydrogenase [Holophagaceae bacterium]|nr:delta-1-pyrroline-5-carboxylate dehydrogenase [Holophagaceae bacterium]
MTDSLAHPLFPQNEPVKTYAPGSPERASLQLRLGAMAQEVPELPLILGGHPVRTGLMGSVAMPHEHRHLLAKAHLGGAQELLQAVDAARKAKPAWSELPWEARAAIFLKAADLLAGPWRDTLNAATMLGQSKTCHQAEIDSACELIDFLRFNVHFYRQLLEQQPQSSAGCWNRLDYRPLEGFVFAVTPFNFTAIAGNLPTAPALCGNTIVWKPASTALYSAHFLMKLLQEAGLPEGVINLVAGPGATIGEAALASPELAGIHFTGSSEVFQGLWQGVSRNLERYRCYPRLVGETGGKDFILAHPSADQEALAVAMVRGAFEYQGQKCSAASRAYIPASLWPLLRERLVPMVESIRMGDVQDFSNFMGAVIDAKAFATQREAIEEARHSTEARILVGGGCDDRQGYFVEPTILEVSRPDYPTMERELFGPILSVFVYPDDAWKETLGLVNSTSPYALTGAIFAQDRQPIEEALKTLRQAAGNIYINDKPTGAVVGQQPFGGARRSGTNDKAGSLLNLLRWVSPRTIKETFAPPKDYRYPFMA